MTREDAIVILKDIQDNLEETSFLKRCAIDMAIEALKEQRPRCRFRSRTNCDFCSFHSDCDEHWKEGE